MTAFATTDDVASVLQRPLTPEETVAAALLLDIVSSEIEDAIGRSYAGGTNVAEIPGNWDQWLELPASPTSISSVAINGTALDSASGYFWRAGRLLRRGPNPSAEMEFAADYDGPILQGAQPYIGSFHWGGPGSTVTVTTVNPSSTVPPRIRGYAIRAVIGVLTNPTQVQSETLGAYSVTYAGTDTGSIAGTLGVLSAGQVQWLQRRYRRPSGTIIPTVR